MLKLGSHVGMKAPDYILGSVNEALSYNANALMLYTGAPQNSFRLPIGQLKVQEGIDKWENNGHQKEDIIVHCPYLINLANTTNQEIFETSVKFLKIEIERSKAIGAKYIVLHPGSCLKDTSINGIESVIKGLDIVLENEEGFVLCLETMAGKGSEVGKNFEEIKMIIDGVKRQDLIGVCLDTCHIWDGGYDLNNCDKVLKDFEQIIGLEKLHVIHLNDSKNVLGSHKDRHANIGQGEIGFKTLYNLLHDKRLENKVFILETPYIEDKPPYKKEIEMLQSGIYEEI